jgi:hypothetical protein
LCYRPLLAKEKEKRFEMAKQHKLDFNRPMTRELIDRIINKEMEMDQRSEERELALNYMTQLVEQSYVVTDDPTRRYTMQELMNNSRYIGRPYGRIWVYSLRRCSFNSLFFQFA